MICFLFTIFTFRWKHRKICHYLSSSVHVDNKGKDILILGEGPAQGLDDIKLTAEAKYPINLRK